MIPFVRILFSSLLFIGTIEFSFAEMLPQSDDRRLIESDLADMDSAELRIARNEIFARRGFQFNSRDLTAHFSQFGWYQPYTRNVQLTGIEKYNVGFIKKYEKNPNLLAGLRSNSSSVYVSTDQNFSFVQGSQNESLNKLQFLHERTNRELVALRKLIRSLPAVHAENDTYRSAVLGHLTGLVRQKETSVQEFNRQAIEKYQTPIKPSNPNVGDTIVELAKSFPKVPFYIAGSNQSGEMWLEPKVTQVGELVFFLNFVDPNTDYNKVIETVELTSNDIALLEVGLRRAHKWSIKAQKENIRRRFEKLAACTNPTHCESRAKNDSSVQLDFLIYEDGATGAKISQNKGAYSQGFNYSIESALLLASYFGFVLEQGKKEFEAGSRTAEDLDKLFD